ncbi:MAG: transglycosylase SLT domain-containing protein [Burkholderiaceae bacterium]
MHAAAYRLVLIGCLAGGPAAHAADHRLTLADHAPASPLESGDSATALLERGQIAMLNMDFELAAKSYCHAARLGSADGSYRLGRLLMQQRGLPLALGQARHVLGLAKALGSEEARQLLATEESFGRHLPTPPTCMPEQSRRAMSPSDWIPKSFDPGASPISDEAVERYLKQLDAPRRAWARRVQARAPFHGVDPRLALSVVRAESNFDPQAVSPANAQGLMQLLPETALRFGVIDIRDPNQNIEGGLAYLRWLLVRYDHDVLKATAAYNAGEGAVERHKGVPPFPETRAYVERVLRFYRAALHTTPPTPQTGLLSHK